MNRISSFILDNKHLLDPAITIFNRGQYIKNTEPSKYIWSSEGAGTAYNIK